MTGKCGRTKEILVIGDLGYMPRYFGYMSWHYGDIEGYFGDK